MNFPIHWMLWRGFPTSNKITYNKIRWPFSLEEFCFGTWSRDILKSSAAVISSTALCWNQRVTKHRQMEYIYISCYFPWISDYPVKSIDLFSFSLFLSTHFGFSKTQTEKNRNIVTAQSWTVQVVKIKYAPWPCCAVCTRYEIILWSHGFSFDFSHNFLNPHRFLIR